MKFKVSGNRFARLNFLFVGFVFVEMSLLFLFGFSLNKYIAYGIVLLAFFLANTIIKFKKDVILLNVISVLFFCLLIFFSHFYFDLTYDGQSYHQEMIIQISNGWNPVFENINANNNQSIWLNHYSKGYETIAGVFYKILNSIVLVKFINTLFLVVSFLYSYTYFNRKKDTLKSFLIAFIIAFNPVVLTQLMTNLIDGFLYSTTIIAFFSFLLSKSEKNYIVDFLIGLILLINIKFTGLVFGTVLFSCFVIYSLLNNKEKRILQIKKSALVLLIILPFTVMPYGKNLLSKGHPFYPLMGEGKMNFIESYVPDIIKDKGRLSRLVFTNFVSIGNRKDSKLKIPFTFTFNELQKMRNGGPRVGSFGVWWGGILLFSLMYYLISIVTIKNRFKFSVFEFIILVIVGVLLINKAGWWLRYTPYFWLIPLLLFLSIEKYKTNNFMFKMLFFLVLINAILTLTVSIGVKYKDAQIVKNKLLNLSELNLPINVDFGSYLGNKVLFKEFNIKFIEKKAKNFKKSIQFNDAVKIEEIKNNE